MAAKKQAQVIITANASVAERVMQELEGAATRASNRMKALAETGKQIKAAMQQLAAANKQNTDEYKALDQQLKQNNRDFKAAEKEFQAFNSRMRENVKDTKRVQEVMKDLANTATRDLRRALQAAKRELDKMSAKDPRRQQLVSDMKKIQAQIEANTGAIKKQQGAFGALGTTMKNLFAYAGIFAGFNKLKSMVESVFKINLKLSDSLADIRKVSGLTMEEINQLYTNISKIDTRNTVETLNKLAYAGAKLGIGQYGVSGLTGFVKAAEQVQMALGEDLGEEALPALAKLTEVMGLINNYGVEQAMQKTASAIFQLGATSTATGKNIVEFSKRLMGLANVSNVSADELLALGSAADAMGLMPEVAATAFNKLFTSLQKNHNLIEKSLGIDAGTIDKLYQQGKTMEAMVLIFERMKETGNMNALGGVFKDLGSDGARLVNVMATMADRVDILKKHLKTSTEAFKEGEAVIAEYMIQNETAAALMERASNTWVKAFANPEGVDMVKEMADEWYRLSREMTQNQAVMFQLKTAIQGIALAIETLVKLMPFLIHAFAFAGILATVRSLYTGIVSLVTAIRTATTAQMTFNAACQSNVVLALVSAVAALGAMWYESAKAAEWAAEQERERQEELQKAYAKSKEAIEDAVRPLKVYKNALDDANMSEQDKLELTKQFTNDYQDYLDYLGIEVNTVDQLADAYADVVKVMKQKRAYEERENYREQVNGTNKMNRIASGAEVERELRKMRAGEGIDKSWIMANQAKGTKAVYDQIMRQTYGAGAFEVTGTGSGRWAIREKGKIRELTNKALWNAIDNYIGNARTEKALDQTVNDMFKDDVGDFDLDKWNEERMKNRLKRRGGLTKLKPDKEAQKALTKAQQEEKKHLRKEMEDAQKDSTAVINAIEEFYRLQESAIEQLAADGKMTREEADRTIDYIRNRKDQMLLEARRAITGNENNFTELRKTMDKDLLRPDDTASLRAKETVQTVDVNAAAAKLKKFDGSAGVYDLNAGSFTQSVLKNAAQNELNIQRRQAKVTEEVNKILMQYQFVEQAQKDFGDKLVKLGLVTEGYDKVVKQLADGTEIVANTKDVQSLAQKVHGVGTRLFNVDYDDAEELRNMVNYMMTTVDKGGNRIRESFASMFPDLDEWLAEPEKYKREMQVFYQTLIDYDTAYYEAIKRSHDQQKKLFEERWEASGKGKAYADVGQEISFDQRRQKMTGADQGTNFAQMAGFAQIGQDPEVQASLLRMAQMQEELEMYKQVNEAKDMSDAEREAFLQGVHEREMALAESEKAMQESLMANINEQISKMQQWTEPIQQFSMDIGEAFGQTLVSGESMSEGLRNALKSLVQSWGQSTIQIVKDLMMQQLKQKLIGKMMVKQEKQTQGEITQTDEESGKARLNATNIIETGMASVMQTMGNQMLTQKQAQDSAEMSAEGTKTTGTVMAGIAQGAAKIIGTLGPWGAPLIAVITALLMGLLSVALGALGGGSKKETASTKATPKLKLVSGMLTYDEGNLNNYVGNDGHVYRAREQKSLPEGVSVIKEPIATTVNGQPSLVAEKGPEIVIGRKTSRRIMMNEPGILHSLMAIERGGRYSGRGYRLFDEGNLGDVMGDMETGRQGVQDERMAAALEQNTSMMQAMMQTIQQLQAKGIPATVAPFGKGSLDEGMRSVQNFRKKYPNG